MRCAVPSPGSLFRLAAVVLACLVVGTFTEPVRAWNGRGHKLVAFIAFQHLNSTVSAAETHRYGSSS
jgi:hypothetical protein